jgi:hypothetical protein
MERSEIRDILRNYVRRQIHPEDWAGSVDGHNIDFGERDG